MTLKQDCVIIPYLATTAICPEGLLYARCFLNVIWFIQLFIFLSLFILRERERKHEQGRGREGERIPSRLHAVSAEPKTGLNLTNYEIMTWAEIKNQILNWLSNPGAPNFFFYFRECERQREWANECMYVHVHLSGGRGAEGERENLLFLIYFLFYSLSLNPS